MNTKLFSIAKSWLPTAIIITMLSGLVYVAVQQNYRMSANDPQIQLAEDVAEGLSSGKKLGQFNEQLDISKSLAVFIIIYDDKGNAVASSAVLNGKVPLVPAGVIDYTRVHGEDRLTWEPQPGVRSAIVVTKYTGAVSGFVLAGRSLREVEQREKMLTIYVFVAWLGTLVLTFASMALSAMFPKSEPEV